MIMEAARNTLALDLHPLCTLFPRLSGAEFEALKADIIANGQREPITVHEGFVLDGGNRYRACIDAGIEPILRDFAGTDPVAFVLSANLHRRHLTPGQQAAIVASAQDWSAAQTVGNPAFKTLPQSGNVAGLETVADRAAQSGASERTQRMADKVAKANPELAKRVAHGEISLPKALEQLAPTHQAGIEPDDLYEQAVALVLKSRRASISLVQRHLQIGYNRAARLLEQMERAGVVSPMQSNGDRIIMALASHEQQNHQLDQNERTIGGEGAAPTGAEEGAPAAAAEPDPFNQLLADFNTVQRERDELRTRVQEIEALLALDDAASAADNWKTKFEQLSGRNRQLQQTAHDAQTAEKRASDLLAKVRKALGVESNAEILPALSARRAA